MNAITLTVNGRTVSHEVEPRTHLADFVRETLHLTGTHLGCEHGVCGACTILLDGRPVRGCLTLAATCSGADVRTVEGFAGDPVMAALREAFSRHHGLQCGYCTPGFLATAYDIVTRLPDADEARVREELAGNLCRCTGYTGIVEAIGSVLAAGVPEPTVRPTERRPVPPQDAPTRPTPPPQEPARPHELPALPDTLDNPVTLSRSVDVPVPVDRLWATVQDIEAVARCLPGASLEEVGADGTVVGAFAVAIGPMTARFRGRAKVVFDPATRTGRVLGSGGDEASRSRADGAITFAAEPGSDPAAARLAIEIAYELTGPLAQFGRPAVIAGVVDRLLERFAANLRDAAAGRDVAASAPIGGIGLLGQTLVSFLRRLLGRR